VIRSTAVKLFPYETARVQYEYSTRIRRRLRQHSPSTDTAGVDYSARALGAFGKDRRIEWTTGLLSSIPDVDLNSLLCIGPRFTTELIVAEQKGFHHDGIRGLDTFSYSDRVDTGDMHALPYSAAAFGTILCGWTLSYSTDPATAASEMQRVLRPGGYLLIAVQYVEPTDTENVPGVFKGSERIQTLPEFDSILPGMTRVIGLEAVKQPGGSSHTIAVYKKPIDE
jgi:SAM-dependent methyltransferase